MIPHAVMLILLALVLLYATIERDRRMAAERRTAMLVDILRKYGFDITLHDNGVSVIQWSDDDDDWRDGPRPF